MYENLSNESLLFAWERTRRMLSDLANGVEAPAYPESLYRWYMAAEAELERRGFVETSHGGWIRSKSDSVPTRASVTVSSELTVVG